MARQFLDSIVAVVAAPLAFYKDIEAQASITPSFDDRMRAMEQEFLFKNRELIITDRFAGLWQYTR